MPKARPGSITTGRAPDGGSSHGGPTQSGPISTGVVELAPALLPVLGDLAGGGFRERREHTLRRGAVRGELDPVAAGLDLLEPLGRELEEAGAEQLGVTGGGGDGGADQWNALFSFSKKPASWR